MFRRTAQVAAVFATVAIAQAGSPEVSDIVNLLKVPGSPDAKRTCTIRVDSSQEGPCTEAWFILYKDRIHAVQFTGNNLVIQFVGTAVNADTISIKQINVRAGTISTVQENKATGQCVLGRMVASCQARLSNGQLIFGDIVTDLPEAANKTDPKFVWPKNSQFNCSGVLTQEEGTYRLKPDQGNLTWCDADIDGKDKGRVLDGCKLGDRCEIKGTISGHGAFSWVEITSVGNR